MNRRAFLAALGAVTTEARYGRGPLRRLQSGAAAGTGTVTTSRSPYIQNVRSDRASIVWATLEAGVGRVRYSVDGINFNTVVAQSRFFPTTVTLSNKNWVQYQADLTGLTPNTSYMYTPSVNGIDINTAGAAQFRTSGPGPFNFFVLGDSGWGFQNQPTEQYIISQQMIAENPALVIHTGDLVYNPSGTYDSFQANYFNYYAQTMSSVPFFPCPGNHDYEVQNGAPYLSIHAFPTDSVPPADRGRYYSFDWGNVHFVSLDVMLSLDNATNGSGGGMLRWLENDLRSTRQFWKIVYFHQPAFATGPNENDPISLGARAYVVPILDDTGVQICLSGHEHSYQRSQPIRKSVFVDPGLGTNYFTSGGGGAPLYAVSNIPLVAFGQSAFHYLRAEVQGTQITIHAIQYDGTEIDSTTIAPAPVFSDDPRVPQVTLSPGPIAGATIRIIGRNLAAEETFLCTPAAPTTMAGTVVTVNGQPVQLLYVSPTQIYAQLPFPVSGNITIRVTTANGFVEKSI
jgi:3',5'-cyclic AMP phosphodiesterase CpdA